MNTDLAATYGPAEFSARFEHKDFYKILASEFATVFSVPITGACENFMKPTNQNQNRFKQYSCWDDSRVVLSQTNDGADYINANYVSGFDLKKKFIVTEHPVEKTLNNFWTMVWQENTRVIVMLTSAEKELRTSKIRYFPYNTDDTIISDFIIKEDKIVSESNYTETVLNIINKKTGELRTVHHFKFLDWPEGQITVIDKLLDFLLAVNEENHEFFVEAAYHNRQLPGPIVVHGSKGIGRTSIFCAIDTCLYQLVVTTIISVPSVVLRIRQQRCSNHATLNQYTFIHMVLHYFLNTIRSNYALFVKFRSHFTAKDMILLNHPTAINLFK